MNNYPVELEADIKFLMRELAEIKKELEEIKNHYGGGTIYVYPNNIPPNTYIPYWHTTTGQTTSSIGQPSIWL